MKICDLILQTGSELSRQTPAICRVRVFHSPDNGVVALLTDLEGKNTGQSVTNAIELFRDALLKRGIVTESAAIISHYEECFNGPQFDLISFDQNGRPSWQPMTLQSVAIFVAVSEQELRDKTLENPRLYQEIERMRVLINPYSDFPYAPSVHTINRREDIRLGMIDRCDVAELVNSGSSERILQRLLRRDLSILGEVYANPREEYICFAELPLGNGYVDFAVFTGRSCMEVLLIEVKGADFAFLTRGSYRNISAKINEAAQQLRKRLGEVYRDMCGYRDHFHGIRSTVEAGGVIHSAFVGPKFPLLVDPAKDISLRGVVIGGRSTNDLEESKLRQEFERGTSPPFKVESWDSWMRKLQRD